MDWSSDTSLTCQVFGVFSLQHLLFKSHDINHNFRPLAVLCGWQKTSYSYLSKHLVLPLLLGILNKRISRSNIYILQHCKTAVRAVQHKKIVTFTAPNHKLSWLKGAQRPANRKCARPVSSQLWILCIVDVRHHVYLLRILMRILPHVKRNFTIYCP